MIYKKILLSILLLLSMTSSVANDTLISLFPLDHYEQNVSAWLKPDATDHDAALLTPDIQQQHFDKFIDHYVGSHSPWNADYVNKIYRPTAPDDLKTEVHGIIHLFSNQGKTDKEIGYGENFRPYQQKWINNISQNINLSQFDHLIYQPDHRAITITNLYARALPTNDPHYYSHKLPGQGYPFDNLQMSAVFIGSPIYVMAETEDHAWSYVITSDFIAWVETSGIAKVDQHFVNMWTQAAKNKLIAITKTQTNLMDNKNRFIASTYVGTTLPGYTGFSTNLQVMVPVINSDHEARIKYVNIATTNAAIMPLKASRRHFAMLMNTLINRPYGWGNLYFYNDCSSELKNLLTPFGIWLPRHSATQVNVGKMVDMSSDTKDARLSYLIQNGKSLLTLIYVGNHVVLYVGNYENPNKPGETIALTYQNVWGLHPSPSVRRAVIGQSVFLPMLLQFPEDTSLMSQAAGKYFKVSYLDQQPVNVDDERKIKMNLKPLLYPETTE